MTNNSLILLILIFLVDKAPYPSIVYFFKESIILVIVKCSYLQSQWIRDAKYQKFAQERVTVSEIRGIVWRMKFTIVCNKVKETISHIIIVAYWDKYGWLKFLWHKAVVQKTLMIILRLNLLFCLHHNQSYCYCRYPLK